MVSYEKLSRERKCVYINNGLFLAINSQVMMLQEREYPDIVTLHELSQVQ